MSQTPKVSKRFIEMNMNDGDSEMMMMGNNNSNIQDIESLPQKKSERLIRLQQQQNAEDSLEKYAKMVRIQDQAEDQ